MIIEIQPGTTAYNAIERATATGRKLTVEPRRDGLAVKIGEDVWSVGLPTATERNRNAITLPAAPLPVEPLRLGWIRNEARMAAHRAGLLAACVVETERGADIVAGAPWRIAITSGQSASEVDVDLVDGRGQAWQSVTLRGVSSAVMIGTLLGLIAHVQDMPGGEDEIGWHRREAARQLGLDVD